MGFRNGRGRRSFAARLPPDREGDCFRQDRRTRIAAESVLSLHSPALVSCVPCRGSLRVPARFPWRSGVYRKFSGGNQSVAVADVMVLALMVIVSRVPATSMPSITSLPGLSRARRCFPSSNGRTGLRENEVDTRSPMGPQWRAARLHSVRVGVRGSKIRTAVTLGC
jgi:hypothetical protein